MDDREKQVLKATQEIVKAANMLKGKMPKALNDNTLTIERVEGDQSLIGELMCIQDWLNAIVERADGNPEASWQVPNEEAGDTKTCRNCYVLVADIWRFCAHCGIGLKTWTGKEWRWI